MLAAALWSAALAAGEAAAAAPAAPHGLLLEYLPAPVLGVDVPKPRFSWGLSSTERSVVSAAYQVVVTTKAGAAVWDSGKVAGDASGQVECGATLAGNTAYEWKVRWWSSGSSPSAYSAPAAFHTGPMAVADWHGAVPIDLSLIHI